MGIGQFVETKSGSKLKSREKNLQESLLSTILKVHLHEIFHFKLVWPKEPI
jgi:hypothetical protein